MGHQVVGFQVVVSLDLVRQVRIVVVKTAKIAKIGKIVTGN